VSIFLFRRNRVIEILYGRKFLRFISPKDDVFYRRISAVGGFLLTFRNKFLLLFLTLSLPEKASFSKKVDSGVKELR